MTRARHDPAYLATRIDMIRDAHAGDDFAARYVTESIGANVSAPMDRGSGSDLAAPSLEPSWMVVNRQARNTTPSWASVLCVVLSVYSVVMVIAGVGM